MSVPSPLYGYPQYLPPPGIPNPRVHLPAWTPTPWVYLPPPGYLPPPQKGTWDQRYLPFGRNLVPEIPPTKQTHTYENITFPQLRWRSVKGLIGMVTSMNGSAASNRKWSVPYGVTLFCVFHRTENTIKVKKLRTPLGERKRLIRPLVCMRF